jgi:hypothetical protein
MALVAWLMNVPGKHKAPSSKHKAVKKIEEIMEIFWCFRNKVGIKDSFEMESFIHSLKCVCVYIYICVCVYI